ncbi:uncharacterized protein LOC129896228 [Solanum dulcamara]|uniref:uncharacterized protein LOC129896228 n=1 Tax=Solanum dulcamara TaxID=45834 RepID=UPI0024850AEC|nr:uncharacterized protein LOC129896228 [Solanum dulcamara]
MKFQVKRIIGDVSRATWKKLIVSKALTKVSSFLLVCASLVLFVFGCCIISGAWSDISTSFNNKYIEKSTNKTSYHPATSKLQQGSMCRVRCSMRTCPNGSNLCRGSENNVLTRPKKFQPKRTIGGVRRATLKISAALSLKRGLFFQLGQKISKPCRTKERAVWTYLKKFQLNRLIGDVSRASLKILTDYKALLEGLSFLLAGANSFLFLVVCCIGAGCWIDSSTCIDNNYIEDITDTTITSIIISKTTAQGPSCCLFGYFLPRIRVAFFFFFPFLLLLDCAGTCTHAKYQSTVGGPATTSSRTHQLRRKEEAVHRQIKQQQWTLPKCKPPSVKLLSQGCITSIVIQSFFFHNNSPSSSIQQLQQLHPAAQKDNLQFLQQEAMYRSTKSQAEGDNLVLKAHPGWHIRYLQRS